MTDKIIYIDKLGSLNEVPLIYTRNHRYERVATATLNQDGIICGIVINGSVIKDFGTKPFFSNLTEIERYLCTTSTNSLSKLPTIHYRVAGVPIEFVYKNPFFYYQSNFSVHEKNVQYIPKTNVFEINVDYLSDTGYQDYQLQKFDGLKWNTVTPFSSDTYTFSIINKEVEFYRFYYINDNSFSQPIIIEPEKILSKFLELTN